MCYHFLKTCDISACTTRVLVMMGWEGMEEYVWVRDGPGRCLVGSRRVREGLEGSVRIQKEAKIYRMFVPWIELWCKMANEAS